MPTDSPITLSSDVLGNLKKNWGWMLAVGIIFIVLGTIGLGMSGALTLASVMIFGILLLIGGGVQLADAFKCTGWKGMLWHVLIALLYIAAGFLMINRPLLASTAITAMLAGAFMVIGVFRIFIAIRMRDHKGWIWLLIAGLISLALGIMIMNQWPVSGLWVIGLFVAIEMIFHGWSYVLLALAAKNSPGPSG